MKLLEYEAKQILMKHDVAVPDGVIVRPGSELPRMPRVIKSQVPVGGRGKAGGIRTAHSKEEAEIAAGEVFDLDIKGYKPKVLLAEKLLDIDRELYLSILINRESSQIELVAHRDGGVEVESHDTDEFFRHELTSENIDAVGQTVADYLDIPEHAFTLVDMIENLYKCFVREDVTLLEINPLVVTKQDKLVAADCKMELDDMAAFRHPDWNFEDKIADANFVTLDDKGTVATIANGAGLAMATVDAVVTAGLRPANFLDIGGGATTEKVVTSFRQIMQISSVDAIVINIFGGIVQCDTVARAIIEAGDSIDNLPKLYIRLSGTNADIAAELLAGHGIALYPTLKDCLEAIS